MKTKVGIPRGMFYYDYYVLWESFFTNLEVDFLVSPRTNKDILNRGVHTCVDEACLPVKVFHGHVDYLKDKVDYIFIPKFISIYKNEYCCPKHLGLPNMVKHSIEDLPELIVPEINLKKSNKTLKNAILSTGKYFTDSSRKILKAYDEASNEYKKYLRLQLVKEGKRYKEDILILGHSYTVYDQYINMNVIDKLTEKGIKAWTSDMVNKKSIRYNTSKLSKRMFWSQGQKITGGAFSFIEENRIDGIIYVSSFGCGLDSVLIDLVERKCKENKIPFMLLTIDEQTGEAGINTRIEAFLDMLEWRAKDENNFSTYG